MSRIAASQTRALAAAWNVVAPAVFVQHRPADRVLAEFLKQHPEFGGRDRRLIGDTVHGLLRWWGWLGPCVPGEIAAESPAWARALLAVTLLEGAERLAGRSPSRGPTKAHPSAMEGEPQANRISIADYWARQGGLGAGVLASWRAISDASAHAAAALGGVAADFKPMRLVPAWTLNEIDCPRPLPELIAWLQRRAPLWLRVQAEDLPAVETELRAA